MLFILALMSRYKSTVLCYVSRDASIESPWAGDKLLVGTPLAIGNKEALLFC